MTFFSLLTACRCLSIMPKPCAAGWRCSASLQSLPHDGRKKSREPRAPRLLAHLASSQPVSPFQGVSSCSRCSNHPCPPVLLATAETRAPCSPDCRVATAHRCSPNICSNSTCIRSQPGGSGEPSERQAFTQARIPCSTRSFCCPGTPICRSRRTHVIPRVEYGKEGHYVVICPKRGVLPFEQTQKRGLPGWLSRTRFALWGKEATSRPIWWRVKKGGLASASSYPATTVHSRDWAPWPELTLLCWNNRLSLCKLTLT